MKEITLDIKSLIVVFSFIAVLGGFYYSTLYRLDALELDLENVAEQLDVQTGELKQIKKQLRRLSK
jgi:hypothetical protein